jgi:hypothetical protein
MMQKYFLLKKDDYTGAFRGLGAIIIGYALLKMS